MHLDLFATTSIFAFQFLKVDEELMNYLPNGFVPLTETTSPRF